MMRTFSASCAYKLGRTKHIEGTIEGAKKTRRGWGRGRHCEGLIDGRKGNIATCNVLMRGRKIENASNGEFVSGYWTSITKIEFVIVRTDIQVIVF